MSAHRIDVGGLALAVSDCGVGPPLVVLHGFTGSRESMIPVIEQLREDCRVIAVDLVGHGASDRPDTLDPYRMASVVDQLDLLLDRLQLRAAAWLGYSMGGRAALAFAVAHPERVERLVLIGASAGIEDPRARAERVAADEALAERIERDGMEVFVDRWMALPLFASQARLGPEALAAARSQRLENDPHALARSLRGMGSGAQKPLQGELDGLSVPVCLVVGEEDAKFDAIARDLAARLADARVERVAEAGHAAHLENPSAFGHIARAFLRQEGRV